VWLRCTLAQRHHSRRPVRHRRPRACRSWRTRRRAADLEAGQRGGVRHVGVEDRRRLGARGVHRRVDHVGGDFDVERPGEPLLGARISFSRSPSTSGRAQHFALGCVRVGGGRTSPSAFLVAPVSCTLPDTPCVDTSASSPARTCGAWASFAVKQKLKGLAQTLDQL
jgi:hypothetical protein